jgi:hypothetical protein
MTFHVEAYGRPKFRMRLLWLFGLLSKELGKGKRKPEEKKMVAEGKPKRRKRRIRATTILQILRTKGLLKRLGSLLRDTISRLSIKEFKANFRVGLDDPADTGLLFAIIGPAIFFLSSSWHNQIRVEPSFEDEAVFEGYLYGTVRLRPIQLVPPFIRFIFSLSIIRVLKVLVLTKWKRKK